MASIWNKLTFSSRTGVLSDDSEAAPKPSRKRFLFASSRTHIQASVKRYNGQIVSDVRGAQSSMSDVLKVRAPRLAKLPDSRFFQAIKDQSLLNDQV